MTGLEPLVVGYLTAWAVRKARRIGDRADGAVDIALDASMDRLDALVRARVGAQPAIVRLEQEAAGGSPAEPTARAAELVIADAVKSDEEFAGRLRMLVDEIRAVAAPQHVAVYATASGEAKMPVLGSGSQTNTFH